MNAMIPIERQGKVIGYIWSNELVADVAAQIDKMDRSIFLVLILCCTIVFTLFFLLTRRSIRDVEQITTGIRSMRADMTQRIPHSSGIPGEITNFINEMADNIHHAKEKAGRAVTALHDVMDHAATCVYICDPHTKELVYVNEHIGKLLNRPRLQGRTCHVALYDHSTPCDACPQASLFDEKGNPVFEPVRRDMYNEALNMNFLVTDRLVTWLDNRILHVSVAVDVTARKTLSSTETRNSDRHGFLTQVTHNIRALVSNVFQLAKRVSQSPLSAEQSEHLEKIQSISSLLLDVTSDITDFSAIETGVLTLEKQVVDLREIADDVVRVLHPYAEEKELTVTISIANTVPEHCFGDRRRLRQILMNLVSNALKFTLRGAVSLELTAEPLPESKVRITGIVKDSGIGISKEQLDMLFKPFPKPIAPATAIQALPRMGLGLFITRALVELMEGNVSVNSTVGEGSEFLFSVNLACLPEKFVPLEMQNEQDARYDGYRVLLVENEASHQEAIRQMLADTGMIVTVAHDGLDCVKAFLQNDYALIIMNMTLPLMNGGDTTSHIRASNKHDAATVPIIAITKDLSDENIQSITSAGMSGYMAQPVDIVTLRHILFHHLAGHHPSV
ncbi:MAG: response regulator [Burkholderiaceae bacterium]|nr:response regulator [Burkholderiaceae bacterium]